MFYDNVTSSQANELIHNFCFHMFVFSVITVLLTSNIHVEHLEPQMEPIKIPLPAIL